MTTPSECYTQEMRQQKRYGNRNKKRTPFKPTPTSRIARATAERYGRTIAQELLNAYQKQSWLEIQLLIHKLTTKNEAR